MRCWKSCATGKGPCESRSKALGPPERRIATDIGLTIVMMIATLLTAIPIVRSWFS